MKLDEVNPIQDTLQYHNKLNPIAWDGWRIKPEIRERLIDIAQIFVDYLELPDFEVEDVVLTGSMVNFNWTKFSDFDLHVVTDYSELKCDDIAQALYHAKKTIWNNQHDIMINGHEVELYIEDTAAPPHSAGVFSVLNGSWLAKPKFMPPKYDRRSVNRKVQVMMDTIETTLKQGKNPLEIKKIIEKIYRMRQSGLEEAGEFSNENLAFKVLRNMGFLEKLRDRYNQLLDKKMSI